MAEPIGSLVEFVKGHKHLAEDMNANFVAIVTEFNSLVTGDGEIAVDFIDALTSGGPVTVRTELIVEGALIATTGSFATSLVGSRQEIGHFWNTNTQIQGLYIHVDGAAPHNTYLSSSGTAAAALILGTGNNNVLTLGTDLSATFAGALTATTITASGVVQMNSQTNFVGSNNAMLAPFNVTGNAATIWDRHEGIWLRAKQGSFIIQLNVMDSQLQIGGGSLLDTTPVAVFDYLLNSVAFAGAVSTGALTATTGEFSGGLDLIGVEEVVFAGSNETDNTNKTFVVTAPHYDTDEEHVSCFAAKSLTTGTIVYIGGGIGFDGTWNMPTSVFIVIGDSPATTTPHYIAAFDSSNIRFGDALNLSAYVAINTTTALMEFTGDASGLSYGSLYLHEASVTVNVVDGSYVKITGLTTGELNNVGVFSDAFRVSKAGRYKVDWQIAADSDGSNLTYECDIFLNGVEQADGSSRRKFGAASDYGSFSGTAILDITNTGHDLDLRIKGIGTAVDLDIFHLGFNIVQIGGS